MSSPEDRLDISHAALLACTSVAELERAGRRGELDIRGPRRARVVRRRTLYAWMREREAEDV